MRSRLFRLLLLSLSAVAIVGLAGASDARAEEVTCPFEIDVAQALNGTVDGWTTGADPWPMELANLSLFDGPPEELFELVYDDEVEDSDTWTVSWLLDAENPRGYWVRCRYANTLVTIERQLPAGATRCDIVFEKMMSYADGRPVVRSMRCI